MSPSPHICILTARAGGVVQGPRPVHPHRLLSHWTSPVRSAIIINAFWFLLQNLAYEIILTLGQAFEVAYQLALQARKGGHSSTLPESFENKPSKPIPKPRVSIRKSVVSRKDAGAGVTWTRGEGAAPRCLRGGVPVRLRACLSSPFPWPPPSSCLPSSQPSSWKAGGTICLNLQAPKKAPPPLSPLAARRGWALLLPL